MRSIPLVASEKRLRNCSSDTLILIKLRQLLSEYMQPALLVGSRDPFVFSLSNGTSCEPEFFPPVVWGLKVALSSVPSVPVFGSVIFGQLQHRRLFFLVERMGRKRVYQCQSRTEVEAANSINKRGRWVARQTSQGGILGLCKRGRTF